MAGSLVRFLELQSAIAFFSCRLPRGRYVALSFFGAALLTLLLIAAASAQNVAGREKRGIATETVIISNLPERKSRFYGLLAKVLGKAKGERLGLTRSEVWSIPK